MVFSDSGKSAISYRVVHGVALASGDPLGDVEAWPGAMSNFAALAADYAWTTAVIGCSERAAIVFRRELGLSALLIGDEAIVEVSSFTVTGRAMRDVRQACARVERAGYTARVKRVSQMGEEEMQQLREASARWRDGNVERGYSMALSRLGDDRDGECVIVTAHRTGEIVAVLHFVPWGSNGLSLDLMCRARTSDNGLNEFLITELIRHAPGLGVSRVSLNFAMFREALQLGERIGAGPVLRAWRRVLLIASRWWQIDSLYRFNVKFQPAWKPRYLSYPRARDLPRISLAALHAESFIHRPPPLARWLRRPSGQP